MKKKIAFFISLHFLIIIYCFPRFCTGKQTPYQEGTITTIEGSIKEVFEKKNRAVAELGLHLLLLTSSGEYIVHVSPLWYAEQQQIQFLPGELLTVTGSSFKKDNRQNIYAATIYRQFSSLPIKRQRQIALEAYSSNDLKALASKHAIDLKEVERIKTRTDRYLNSALSPEPLQLRNPETGEGLWGGRYYHENMPFNRQKRQEEIQKRQEEIRKKIRERKHR